MFEKQFNKRHAIALREYGFTANQIAKFMECSPSWIYNVVKQKPNPNRVKNLMQHVIDESDEEFSYNILTCPACSNEFNRDSDKASGGDFCSAPCHNSFVMGEDEGFDEVCGDE